MVTLIEMCNLDEMRSEWEVYVNLLDERQRVELSWICVIIDDRVE